MASGKKKTFGDAHEEYAREQEGQPFGQYPDEIFATLAASQVDSGNLPIMSIWADPTQPRNIIPREIHGGWTGSPSAMSDILGAWIEAIYDAGFEGEIAQILEGKQGSDKTNSLTLDEQEPLVQKFLPILTLAAQIRDVGLRQRIGVIETGKKEFRIIFGERRWTAFHLLKMFLGDGYANIPAQVAKVTEWELAKIQAAENFHQNPLNAIGKARQLAKLLILARQATQDPAYDSWDKLVDIGGCNRPYFAQVWDGNKHPIPYGMGQEFELTLNISTAQMRQYRALLRLTGDYEIDNKLWDMGDERDWSERFMRDVAELDLVVVKQIFAEANDPEEMLREAVAAGRADKRSVTMVTDSTKSTPNEVTPKDPFSPSTGTGSGTTTKTGNRFKFGDEVITRDGPGRIIQTTDNLHLVRLDAGATKRYGDITLTAKGQDEASWFGRYVQNPAGGIGEVIADLGEFCEVQYADDGRGNLHKMYLSEVSKEEYEDARRSHLAHEINARSNTNYVRGAQGIAKVVKNIDTRNFRLQFPDGEEFDADKTGWRLADKSEWDAAVAALNDAGDDDEEEDAAPSAGKELSLKDVSYTVTSKIRELNPKAFDGMPTAGWLNFHRAIMAKYGLNHHITLAFYTGGKHVAIDHDANKLAQAMATVKHPYTKGVLNGVQYCYVDWKGIMDVLDKTGAHYIKYRSPGQMEHNFDHWMEAVLGLHDLDNANSPSPAATTDQAAEIKPRDWVGKPALWNEGKGYKIPVVVQEFIGAGMLRVSSNPGKQHEVHFSQLEPVKTDSTKLSDFMSADPDADHSDLLGRNVRLNTGEVGEVTQVDGERLVLKFSEHVTGGALVEHIVEVIDDDEAEETKAITDVETQSLLRHIAHVTRRENTVLKLLALTRQNAIDAHKAGQLQHDLRLIRDSIKSGLEQLLEEVEDILDVIITEAEESAN